MDRNDSKQSIHKTCLAERSGAMFFTGNHESTATARKTWYNAGLISSPAMMLFGLKGNGSGFLAKSILAAEAESVRVFVQGIGDSRG